MTPKSRAQQMRADADKAEGLRGQHDPGEGLRAHVQGEGGELRFRNGIPAGIEPQKRPERVEEYGGIEVDPDPADIAEGPVRSQQQVDLLAALEYAKPCAVCAMPRDHHTVQGLARLGETLGIRPHGFRAAPTPVSDVKIMGVDGEPVQAWVGHDHPVTPAGRIETEQILHAFGVTQEEIDAVAPPPGMEAQAAEQRQAVLDLLDHNAGTLTEGLLRAAEDIQRNALPGAAKREALADIRRAVTSLRAERSGVPHRVGTGPAYRQEGELNAFDMVLDLLDDPPDVVPGLVVGEHERRAQAALDKMVELGASEEQLGDLRQAVAVGRQRDAPSITCPTCERTSYNPNDIRERYCGVCGYHDGSLRK